MLKMIVVCKLRLIETNRKIEIKVVNIVKIDVVKSRFRTKKQKIRE